MYHINKQKQTNKTAVRQYQNLYVKKEHIFIHNFQKLDSWGIYVFVYIYLSYFLKIIIHTTLCPLFIQKGKTVVLSKPVSHFFHHLLLFYPQMWGWGQAAAVSGVELGYVHFSISYCLKVECSIITRVRCAKNCKKGGWGAGGGGYGYQVTHSPLVQ